MIQTVRYRFDFPQLDKRSVRPGLNPSVTCTVAAEMHITADPETVFTMNIITPYPADVAFSCNDVAIAPENAGDVAGKISAGFLNEGKNFISLRFAFPLENGISVVRYRYRHSLMAQEISGLAGSNWQLSAIFDMAHLRRIGIAKDVAVTVRAFPEKLGTFHSLFAGKDRISFSGKNYSEERGVTLKGERQKDSDGTAFVISFGRDIPDQLAINCRS